MNNFWKNLVLASVVFSGVYSVSTLDTIKDISVVEPKETIQYQDNIAYGDSEYAIATEVSLSTNQYYAGNTVYDNQASRIGYEGHLLQEHNRYAPIVDCPWHHYNCGSYHENHEHRQHNTNPRHGAGYHHGRGGC